MTKKELGKSHLISSTTSFGIYIHVPFCIQKCTYCDFGSIIDFTQVPSYIEALLLEISSYPQNTPVDTIYIGGGTPSVLLPVQVEKILKTLQDHFQINKDCEITMEVNPIASSKSYLTEINHMGVNRLSIGVQSFTDEVLLFLGRPHSSQEAIDTIKKARSIFTNVGIDLIYGYPNHTIVDWKETLRKALEFSPNHISAYQLTYALGTPLGQKKRDGKFQHLSEEKEAELFLTTHSVLENGNMLGYEVSNFSQKGYESKHNQKYWFRSPYWGFGPFAHSFEKNKRWWNGKNIAEYIERCKNKRSAQENSEILSIKDVWMEIVTLRLRTKEGLNFAFLPDWAPKTVPALWEDICCYFEKEGLAKVEDNTIRLTQKGWCVADGIVRQLIELPI